MDQQNEIQRLNGIIRSQLDGLNHWRKAHDLAVTNTARECAELASRMSASYPDQFIGHAVGAEAAACAIRNKFGLSTPLSVERVKVQEAVERA